MRLSKPQLDLVFIEFWHTLYLLNLGDALPPTIVVQRTVDRAANYIDVE
jgi:hypothetical protein